MPGCVPRLPRYERGLNLYVELSNWAFRDSSNKTWNQRGTFTCCASCYAKFDLKAENKKVWICHNLTLPRYSLILTSSCWNTETPKTFQTPKTLRRTSSRSRNKLATEHAGKLVFVHLKKRGTSVKHNKCSGVVTLSDGQSSHSHTCNTLYRRASVGAK